MYVYYFKCINNKFMFYFVTVGCSLCIALVLLIPVAMIVIGMYFQIVIYTEHMYCLRCCLEYYTMFQ